MVDYLNIAGRVRTTANDGVAVEAQEIKDLRKKQFQQDINRETDEHLARIDSDLDTPSGGVKARLSTLETQVAFSGEFQVENNPQGIISESGKIATSNAVRGAIDVRTGCFICEIAADDAEKTINAPGYVLSNGGSMKVKMTNANTADNATLNINSTGAKPLFYDGERASATNSWEEGETVEVYYDGEKYYANNVAGGSGSGDGAFDVSAKYPTSSVDGGNTYTLEDALAVLNAKLSAKKKKGGMSIKFIQSSDNKYVQYLYLSSSISDTDFKNISNWQPVTSELEKVKEISREEIQNTEKKIVIQDDNNNDIVTVTEEGLDAKSLKVNNIRVLTQNDKEEIDGAIEEIDNSIEELENTTKEIECSEEEELIDEEIVIKDKNNNDIVTITESEVNAVCLKVNNKRVLTETDLDNINADIAEVEGVVERIENNKEEIFTDESIEFQDSSGNIVGTIDSEGADFKNIKKNGVEILLYPATVEDTYQKNEEVVFEDSEENPIMKISKSGVKVSNITDMEGNPIAPSYEHPIAITDVIYVAVGRELCIYADSVVKSMDRGLNSPMNYRVLFNCNIGEVHDRFYRLVPTQSQLGEHSFRVRAFDMNNQVVIDKTSTLKVIPNTGLTSKKNIVFIASSEGPGIARALFDHFQGVSGVKPNFVGTQSYYMLKISAASNISVGDVYKDLQDNKYKVDYIVTDGEYKRVYVTHSNAVPIPSSSTILTKHSDQGDSTITVINSSDARYECYGGWRFYDFAGVGRPAYRCQVVNVDTIIKGAVYEDAQHNQFSVQETNINADGTGNISLSYISGVTIEDNTTLTKASGTGDSSIEVTTVTLEGNNPLYNLSTQQLDIANYRNTLQLEGKIDIVCISLGGNDANYQMPLNEVERDFKKIYNAFIADNSECKVIVTISGTWGNTIGGVRTNGGAAYDTTLPVPYIWSYRNAFLTKYVNNPNFQNLRIACISAQIDRYYGYERWQYTISKYITEKVTEHSNYWHPNSVGYNQLAEGWLNEILATDL